MPREPDRKGPKIITHRKPDMLLERCQVCKETMERVTPGHLRLHGLTVARYSRMYGAPRPPSRSERGSVGDPSDPSPDLVGVVGDRLAESKVWIACLADEVGERMLNGPLRHRLTALLVTMLSQRAKVHGEAVAILSGALEELREEWRTTQGGRDGGPTDTDTLLRMVDRASKLVADSEDAVQRTMKLALEEQKAAHQYADSMGPTLYAGTGEKLDMPAGLPSGDRETMRNLLSLIGKAANVAGTITVEGGAPARPPGEDHLGSPGEHPPTPLPPTPHPGAPSSSLVDGPSRLAQGNDAQPRGLDEHLGPPGEGGPLPRGAALDDGDELPVNDPGAVTDPAGTPPRRRTSKRKPKKK